MDHVVLGLELGTWIFVMVAVIFIGILIALAPLLANALRRGQVRFPGGRQASLGIGLIVAVLVGIAVVVVIARQNNQPPQRVLALTALLGVFLAGVFFNFRCRDRLGIRQPRPDPLGGLDIPPPVIPMNNVFQRLFIGNPTKGAIRISQLSLWVFLLITLTALAIPLMLPTWNVWLLILGPVIGLVLVFIFLLVGFTPVPGKPPHRAVYMVFTGRTETEFDEGRAFALPWVETLETVNMEKRDSDITIDDVRTIDDAQLVVRLQVPWVPDRDNLAGYLESGEERGVRGLQSDYVKERIREFFRNEIEAREARRKVLRAHVGLNGLITYTFGEEPYLQEPWQVALGYRENISGYVIQRLVIGANNRDELRRGGRPDQFHWGSRILDLNISTILPAGRTKDAADRRAEETAERAAEMFETETEYLTATKLVELLGAQNVHMEPIDAYRLLLDYKMVRSGHGFVIPSLPDALQRAVTAVLGQMSRGGNT